MHETTTNKLKAAIRDVRLLAKQIVTESKEQLDDDEAAFLDSLHGEIASGDYTAENEIGDLVVTLVERYSRDGYREGGLHTLPDPVEAK